jgi:hypothetical protein
MLEVKIPRPKNSRKFADNPPPPHDFVHHDFVNSPLVAALPSLYYKSPNRSQTAMNLGIPLWVAGFEAESSKLEIREIRG